MSYQRLTPPEIASVQDLLVYLLRELEAIERGINQIGMTEFTEMHKPPTKLRTGMVVLADGTDWNPGSGAGFYGYYGSAWHKLG